MSIPRSIFPIILPVIVIVLVVLSPFSTSAEMVEIKLSDGSDIDAHLYKPSGKGPYPGVIVLHHAGGLTDDIKDFSYELRDKDFVTLAVDFETGTGWLDSNILAAYVYLQKLPMVDSRRIAMVGFSKGARLGMESAIFFKNEHPLRPIRAFVSYYLGNTLDVMPTLELPPILFLHGGNDPEIEGSMIAMFCNMQKDMGGLCEAKIYEGTSHAFTRDTGLYGPKDHDATTDAFDRTVIFLNKHLRNAPVQ